jgi:hypothetical protein
MAAEVRCRDPSDDGRTGTGEMALTTAPDADQVWGVPIAPHPDPPTGRRIAFGSEGRYALVRSGLFGTGLAVLTLIGLTGAGVEGQPTLAAWLFAVVGAYIAIGFLVAYAAWRLFVTLDGATLQVRRLRTRTVDLAHVVDIRWRWTAADGGLVLTESGGGQASPRRTTLPMTALWGAGEADAWDVDDSHRLLRAMFDELPDRATFDERAAATFAAAGCRVEPTR